MRSRLGLLLVLGMVATASADPAADPPPARAPLVLTGLLASDVPTPPVPSLRLEAVRIAGERVDSDWRYPEPGTLLGLENGGWFMGYGRYSPRTARSAALHGGSMAATIVGQILMSAGSPAAGVGALLTGATLDAAAADVDRDAESRR